MAKKVSKKKGERFSEKNFIKKNIITTKIITTKNIYVYIISKTCKVGLENLQK